MQPRRFLQSSQALYSASARPSVFPLSRRHVASQPLNSENTSESPKPGQKQPELPPYLSKPLGMKEPPTLGRKAVIHFRDTVVNKDIRITERKHIIKQLGTSYYDDMITLTRYGDKNWVAPPALIKEDRALFFPNIEGTLLKDKSYMETAAMLPGKVSLVSVMSSRISTEHTASFSTLALDKYESNPNFQYIQINLQENVLRSFVVSMFLSNLRRQVPEKHQASYLLSHQNMEYIREPLGLMNKYVGYVYLVDPACKVRWAASAFATEEESKGLMECIRVLLQRFDKKR
ncbi:hypothetical protein BT69DRAFT_125135 [Atractiella rhizophila]|nr:hypothetical protein BT69DRAFT_125135 [Atractiella rhizophila]